MRAHKVTSHLMSDVQSFFLSQMVLDINSSSSLSLLFFLLWRLFISVTLSVFLAGGVSRLRVAEVNLKRFFFFLLVSLIWKHTHTPTHTLTWTSMLSRKQEVSLLSSSSFHCKANTPTSLCTTDLCVCVGVKACISRASCRARAEKSAVSAHVHSETRSELRA